MKKMNYVYNIMSVEEIKTKFIIPYIEKLNNYLCERKLGSYYIFADEEHITKKYKEYSYINMQNKLYKTPDNANKKVASVEIVTYTNNSVNVLLIRIWLRINIIIYHTDKNGSMANIPAWGVNLEWNTDDIKSIKLKIKLIEQIILTIKDNKTLFKSMSPYYISDAIDILRAHDLSTEYTIIPLSLIDE